MPGKRGLQAALEQDDSQICVGFNIIYAALAAGADVTVLVDSGAPFSTSPESGAASTPPACRCDSGRSSRRR